MTQAAARVRLDMWLFRARLCKSRGLAAAAIESGKLRLNGRKVAKPAQSIQPGDVLTLALAGGVQVLRVVEIGSRRGPASEARALYSELLPGQSEAVPAPGDTIQH